MGTLPDRASMLELLDRLQQPLVLSHGEVSAVVERDHWWGAGVGFVDAHLLASTLASTSVRLWTKDRRLNMLAARYGLNMEEVAAR